METEVLRMEHITKVYPNGVVANSDINFSVCRGEIHALSGENGAGKSTLMKILFGEERATDGTIYIDGRKCVISSATDAILHGIGMVHQHFMLVPSLTVVENMILGMEPRKGLKIDRKKAYDSVAEIAKKYNLDVPLDTQVQDLTVGKKQKVEILKTLLQGAKLLILDEPTAVLTPQETSELFSELIRLKEDGYTIIFISHKLNEVRAICDRITIIRHGRTMGVFRVPEISEEEISRLMVGRDVVLHQEKPPSVKGERVIEVQNLSVCNALGQLCLNNVSFNAYRGEIVGVAGIEGNGQTELVEALCRNAEYREGKIKLLGTDIRGFSIRQLRKLRVSHIPEDRMTVGIAPNLSITENALADKSDEPRFRTRFGLLRRRNVKQYGAETVKRYQVLCKSPDHSISGLSGGNIQKVVVARELSSDPEIVIANQPTRGVDVGAAEFIRKELLELRSSGKCVLLVSSDLNELLGLSDRLLVLCGGSIVACFPDASSVTEEALGRYMLGIDRQTEIQITEAAR